MSIESIEEGLALHSLGILGAEQIADVALRFLDSGCDVPEVAALACASKVDHPADRRFDFERAVALTAHRFPRRVDAASLLKKIYADRGASGALPPRAAAGLIKETFQLVEAELPKARHYVGDSFGISALIGLYYSYDDVADDDAEATLELERELRAELSRIASEDG